MDTGHEHDLSSFHGGIGCLATEHPTEGRFVVAAWNMQRMELRPVSGTARAKQGWLAERLTTLRPAVVGLMEMRGSRVDFAAWRKWARTLRYECM